MNIENMLYIYDDIPSEVQKLNTELNDIVRNQRQTRDTLKAATISDMPKGSGTSDPTYEAVKKIIDDYGERIKKIADRINWLLDTKSKLEKNLKILSPDEMRVVELRYFQKYKMRRIGYVMHYGKTRLYEIHDKAIIKLKGVKP